MWLTVLIQVAVGGLCMWLGYLIGRKQRLDLIHDYHHRNVHPEDVAAYCKEMGTAMAVIGGGIVLAGFASLFFEDIVMLVLVFGGIALGLVFIHRAQTRYNGGWFSK